MPIKSSNSSILSEAAIFSKSTGLLSSIVEGGKAGKKF
jgi:hypothetical protein